MKIHTGCAKATLTEKKENPGRAKIYARNDRNTT